MDRTALSKDQTTMRQCLSQQQKGIINCLLKSMSLPIAMIGNSFQLHAASCPGEPNGDFRIADAIKLTSNKKKCPAPTHPCREPPKFEKCIEEEEEEEDECYDEEDTYEECEEEEEQDECCCIEENDEEDCIEEDEEDCIEEEEEECEEEEDEDCVEEEEEDCEEEEEEDCVEEEEEECEEEEEEECEEEEEDECEEEEEVVEEECIEVPKPKCASPRQKSPEKETQTTEKLTEKICNGKRQICLEAPPECKQKKKEEPKKEKDCKKDPKREALCNREYKKYINCNSRSPKASQSKTEPKKQTDCYKNETHCKKNPVKQPDCTKEPKKKDCKKKNPCCDEVYKKETCVKKVSKKNVCCDGDYYEKESSRRRFSKKEEHCDGDYEKESSRRRGSKKDECCDGDYKKESSRRRGPKKDECFDEDYGKESSRRKGSKKDECFDEDYGKESSRRRGSKKDECFDEDYGKESSRRRGSKKDECFDEDYGKESSRRKGSKKDECCNGDYKKESSPKKVSKKDDCYERDYKTEPDCEKDTKKTRICSKEEEKTNCDRKPKKETNCNTESKKEPDSNVESKKQSDCYAEEELKKICRKYRNYDCIPPWLGDTTKSRRPNNCSGPNRSCQAEREQNKCYHHQPPRDCCNQGDFEKNCEDDEEECDEEEKDESEYHPEKEGCKICEHFICNKEEKSKPDMEKKNDQNYYFNNKFSQCNLKTWERCSGDSENTIRNIVKKKSREYIYSPFEAKNRSLYTESNVYMHAPRFETLDGGKVKSEYQGHHNTLGTYRCPDVNNNYNGNVVQNEDLYTTQQLYTANEEPHYTAGIAEATNAPLLYTSGTSNEDYSVRNCSFSQICYGDTSGRPQEDSASSEDEAECTAFIDTLDQRDGGYGGSYSSGRGNGARSHSECEDDNQLDEVSEKYKNYGQATAGDDDDYYTTHSKGSNYCDDDCKPGFPVASLSLDNQIYTTRIPSPVQKLTRRKSPAPSMFDVEHLIIDSMSEASNDSFVDSENEAKYSVLHEDGDGMSFTSSLSHFTNNPLENLKRVIATIKKRALGIEDDIQGNVVETVQAKEIDLNSVFKARTHTGLLKSTEIVTGDTICDNGHSHKACQIANSSPFKDLRRKKRPQFLVPSERKPKQFVQLINQTVHRHPFQSKLDVANCNNDNRPTKPHFLVSKSARTQKVCRSNASQDVINHIVKVLAQPENQDTQIEDFSESRISNICENQSSSQFTKVVCVNNEETFETAMQPLSLQAVNYVDKAFNKRPAYTECASSRPQSYSTTPSSDRSTLVQKPNFEKQKLQGKKTKTVKENVTRARSPSRSKSNRTMKAKGFQFRQLANKKDDLEKKDNISEKDLKPLDFIHVPEAVAKSLPFFKIDDTPKDRLAKTHVDKPSQLIDILAAEKPNIKPNKSDIRVFKSLSRDTGESSTSVPKFLKTKVEKTPLKSGIVRSKNEDVSGDMHSRPSFPWRSPHVITKGPMNNGQKLYNYRKSHKRDKENASDNVPEVISPVGSIDEDLEDFHDRIISMEMCDSAKLVRKKIRQVNYMPDRTIFEASESSNSDNDDDDDDRSSKSSLDGHSSSDAWYCDVPVNIVRTQELYRNQRKTNSIVDEIINLTKQRGLSDVAQNLAEEEQTFENSDYFEENTEGRGLLEASHCDQSNASPTMHNADSEVYNTSPYNKSYTPNVKSDTMGKDDIKDSETFLSFNKSMIHHIGRILGKKGEGKNESDNDEDIVPECESPFEVSGNEEVNCNLNSLQGAEDIADSTSNVQKSNSARSLLQPKPSPTNINGETQLRKCAFKLESPRASIMTELETTSQAKSSPGIAFPHKLPFQGPANAFLIATNKIARSNSEQYLNMKEQEREISAAKAKESTKTVQKNTTFKSKPKEIMVRRNTSPLGFTDFRANTANKNRPDKSSPKKSSIWSKLSRDKLGESRSKLDLDKSLDNRKKKTFTVVMPAKTVLKFKSPPPNLQQSQLATSPAASMFKEKKHRNDEIQANISKSVPHIKAKNKITRKSRNMLLTKNSSPVTEKQNVKSSASQSADVEVTNVAVSRSQSSILSNKISATMLTPSTPKNEPKSHKTVRKMQSSANRDSPRLRQKKNKIKEIVEKMEQKKNLKEDPFKLITNRSQESLRSKSGTEMIMKKLEKFKQLVDAKKFKGAITGKDSVVAIISRETESNLTAKIKAERRNTFERLAERKNKGKNNRATEVKEETKSPDVSKDNKTMSTQSQDTLSTIETNIGEGDLKKDDKKKLLASQKKVKTIIMDRKVLEKIQTSSKTTETNKEENSHVTEIKKEELNNANTAVENKPEEPKSYAERRLQELRKKYQRSIVEKRVTPESSLEQINSTTSNTIEKQERKTEEPWKVRMYELKKKNRKAFDEKRALAKVNAEEVKPVELTAITETVAPIEETIPTSLPERRVQEWRQKYQPSLVKRFSKTDVSKEEEKKKTQVKVKGQVAKLAKGRRSSIEIWKTKLLSSDSDLLQEEAKPIIRRHFRSLAKTDIFGIPQAAGKHPRVVKQRYIRSRSRSNSRSRSTSRTNLISPKLKKKPEPPKVHYLPPTILEVKSEPAEKSKESEKAIEKTVEKVAEKTTEKTIEKPSVEPESAQEKARKTRGVTAYKIDRSSGKPVSIKKNELKSSKQQDGNLLTSALETVEDAVNALKSSTPSIIIPPSTLSDQKAALEELKANSHANKNDSEVDTWIKPTLEDDAEKKDTLPGNTGPLIKKEVIRRVRRDGQTSYAIKQDFVGNTEPDNSNAGDLKPTRTITTRTVTPDFNYEKKYDLPNSHNIEMEHYKATNNWIPAPPRQFINNPTPKQNDDDDYLKYADFRQQISNANRQTPRRPIYEPKLASHKFSKPANSYKKEFYQKQAYKISTNEPAQTVRTNSGSVVPPTVLSAPVKSVSTEPEKAKLPPKAKTPSPPASAPTPQSENLISDVSKSTFGMFSKLINSITRTSVFELDNDAEKTKNKNSNALTDDEPSTNFEMFSSTAKDLFILLEDKSEGCQLQRAQEEFNDFNNSNSLVVEVGQISAKTDRLVFDFDEEFNCNNNADSQSDRTKQTKESHEKRGKMSKESHEEKPPVTASNTQDKKLDTLKKIKADHESAQRLRRCYSSLRSCSHSDYASLSTLNTLIEWNFVLMCVILVLLIGTFAPGTLISVFTCPLPSLYNGLYTYIVGSLGINLLFPELSTPAGSCVWKLLFAPKEPRHGLFYSFIYQVIVAFTKLIFFVLHHILIPILSIPFIVFGPIVSSLLNATLCTLSSLAYELNTLALALVGGEYGASSRSKVKLDQSAVISGTSAEDSEKLFDKLQDIQQYASVFFYLGPNTVKKQCAYSVLTSFYLWLTNQTPAECM